MELNTLAKLFEDQIKDLYSAEVQLTKALPKLAKRATSPDLKKALQHHLEETEGHVERLKTLGQELELKVAGKKCKAMEGLIAEGKEILDADGDESVIDAGLIAAAQRVEHYEIAAYGTARAMAEQLGRGGAAKLLQETLDEEKAADQKLTDISEGGVLSAALAAGTSDEE